MSVCMDAELHDRLRRAAGQRSVAGLVREAVARELARLEAIERREAAERG
jgi:hypothetical protein